MFIGCPQIRHTLFPALWVGHRTMRWGCHDTRGLCFVLWALFCGTSIILPGVSFVSELVLPSPTDHYPFWGLQNPNAGFPGGPVIKNTSANAGECVWSLIWEDPACLGATKPICHSYWAYALEPRSCNYWSPTTLEPMLCNKTSHHNEKPMYWN